MAEQASTTNTVSLQPRPAAGGLAAGYVLLCISEKLVPVESGCWEWNGHTTQKGYGLLDLKNYDFPQSTVALHRLIYALCVGPIPEGLCVLHRCDNPPCLRPDHLFLGTNLDNIADKMAKDRHRSPKGEEHGSHRLTAEMVMAIRQRHADGESCASIARDLSFSDSHISFIVRGKSWAHLPLAERG